MFFKLDCKVNGKCVLVNGIYRDGCFIKWCYWCRNGNVYSFGSEIVEFGKFLKNIIKILIENMFINLLRMYFDNYLIFY